MGFWGTKSYDNDLASDALDAGFDSVHGDRYEDLMDDRNPVPFEKVQEQLASVETLKAALAALEELVAELDPEDEDDSALAYAGIVVRHVECKVTVPEALLLKAIESLDSEDIEWPQATERKLRKDKEIAMLKRRLPGQS